MHPPVHLRSCLYLATSGFLAAAGQAQVLEQSIHVHLTPDVAPFQTAIDVPRFDAALGTLIETRIELVPHFGAVLRAENTDSTSPQSVTLLFVSSVTLSRESSALVTGQSNGYVSQFLMPYDGTLDFDGPSGLSQDVHDDQSTVASILPASPEFDAFVGAPGANESNKLNVDVTASPQCEPFGDPAIVFQARVAAGPEVTVTYRYTTNGAPFCAGDGTGSACPCGNFGVAGHGCSSAANAAGASLTASGEPTVSADTFMFSAGDLPQSTVIALIQGDASAGGGVPFGSGLRCLSGSVLRIATHAAGTTASVGGAAGDVSISVAGSIPPSGGTRFYQVAYRESPGACNAAALNFTNGWRVTWRP
jgi:hypothetical protein